MTHAPDSHPGRLYCSTQTEGWFTCRVHDRGHVAVKIQANELNAGMYIYSLVADGKVIDTKRMILTK